MLCERDGGKLWGMSLCGPMVFADAASGTLATNRPAPPGPRPQFLGYANTAARWGDEQWSLYVWALIPQQNVNQRGQLLMHELYHRIQSSIGLPANVAQANHLESLDGRYWMLLEWRALDVALAASGRRSRGALRDAFAFRKARHALVPDAAESERLVELNEGLAQYTGIVTTASSQQAGAAAAREQLAQMARSPSLLRNFGYASGAAYGVLLDKYAPGWTRRLQAQDDLSGLLMAATRLQPVQPDVAKTRYGGAELLQQELARERERQANLAALRRQFIESPVLVLPKPNSASFSNNGMTVLDGAGTIFPSYNTQAEWGSLAAARALVGSSTVTVPVDPETQGPPTAGDWTLTLAPGWVIRPGARPRDLQVVRE